MAAAIITANLSALSDRDIKSRLQDRLNQANGEVGDSNFQSLVTAMINALA
jgi:hypothetical protein